MCSRTHVLLSIALLASACGGDDEKTCDPVAQTGCKDGKVCEVVTDGDPACFAPVEVRGQVFDLLDAGGIAGARVVAQDANGAARSSVAVTDENGNYALAIPSERDADGNPVAVDLTLRADAAGYQTFPSGLRQALPISTGNAALTDGTLVVDTSLTDVGLLPAEAGAGTAQIHGTAEPPGDGIGILVVAEGDAGSFVALASRDGDYRIFNVPAGSYTVTAYALGSNYDPVDATVADGSDSEVDLSLNDQEPGTVTGTVQIVNASGGAVTSVILVVQSTFDEVTLRGQSVPGLRAPEGGAAPDVDGTYTIEGVPAGDYFVLAAFENDDLVRDPDVSIGGTSILNISVSPGETTTVDGFKVTGALEVLQPGADGAEEVSGTPVFQWADDSSEDQYDVVVIDAYGNEVWSTSIAGVSGGTPEVTYAGPALESGLYYQFRVTSSKSGTPISRTEDLKGIFYTP